MHKVTVALGGTFPGICLGIFVHEVGESLGILGILGIFRDIFRDF